MRGILEPEHLILILLVVLVMFGGKKIPELAGGIGKGVREFKKGLNDLGSPDPLPPPPPRATVAAPIVEPVANVGTTVNEGPKRLIS